MNTTNSSAARTQLRRATPADIPALVAMGGRMHAESPRYSRYPYQPERIRRAVGLMLASPACFVLIAERDGAPAGFFGGMLSEHPFSGHFYAGDAAVYVTPECRGMSILPRMLRAFERWADDVGAEEVTLGVSTEVQTERTARLYSRLGYRLSGGILAKELA
jgi:GNAT superfamily N-acetyltransferase